MFHDGYLRHKLYCDNKAVVYKLHSKRTLDPLYPEWDLLEPARKVMERNETRCYHVKGHQDDKTNKFTEVEKLNVKADKLAEQGRQLKSTNNNPLGYRVILHIDNNLITTKYSKQVLHAFTSPEIAEYYKEKKHWTHKQLHSIDWNGLHSFLKTQPMTQRHSNLKMIHGWNVRLTSNNFLKTKCPCGATDSTIHLVYFPHNAILFQKFTAALSLKMKQMRTHRPLREIFLEILTQITPLPWGSRSAQLVLATKEQEEFGSGSVWLW